MVPTIQFLGAVGTVTGSRFLINGANTKVMVDCGLYQGPKELRWNAVVPESRSSFAL